MARPQHQIPKVKIDKGIPMPTPRTSHASLPLDKMQVGDSFTVSFKLYSRVRQYLYKHAKNHGTKFATRTNGKEMRVWRIK